MGGFISTTLEGTRAPSLSVSLPRGLIVSGLPTGPDSISSAAVGAA